MRVARLLSLAGAMLVLAVPSVASANSHTFWRASASGQLWADPADGGSTGLSVLSVPNIGCTGVDAHGFCTGGIYPSLRGAHWIWKTPETVLAQNTSDYGPVIFVRRVDVPKRAETIHSKIHITADNAYNLFVNGVSVKTGNDWGVISHVPVSLHRGANWLVIFVTNFAGPAAPFENPAALLYKLRVTYTT